MQKQVHSRGTEIDTEKCVAMAGGNRFEMVLIASARAREIMQQNVVSGAKAGTYAKVSALKELQEGKIDPVVYLAKAMERSARKKK